MKKVDVVTKIRQEIQKHVRGVFVAQENDCLVLTGELDEWEKVVECGMIAAKFASNIVNNISIKGFSPPPMKISSIVDKAIEGLSPDVLIVGGGVVGCAIFRELSKYELSLALVEKENDLALHASSRNDGMVHVGIDLKGPSKKLKYCIAGNKMMDQLATDLDVEFNRCGQILVFKKNAFRFGMPYLFSKAKKNGVERLQFLSRKRLFEIEPNVTQDAKFGVLFPTGGIICPYNLTVALAENGVQNGGKVFLNTAVLDMIVEDNTVVAVKTNRGVCKPKIVINAAGVFSDEVASLAHDRFFTVHPRKGTNVILDKSCKANVVNTITGLYGSDSKKVKKQHTKGGGVVSTVDGNVLVGPNALETPFKEIEEVEASFVEEVLKKQSACNPNLKRADVITYFTGVRAPTYEEDFVVQKGKWTKNIVHAAGIQSPGLTAAPALAVDVATIAVEILKEVREVLPKKDFNPKRKGVVSIKKLSLQQRHEAIKKNPDYGIVVCRCEEISKGEILDAINSVVPPTTLDGVKRRVRPGMGRCQGGFCSPLVHELFAKATATPFDNVCKKGEGKIVLSDTKGEIDETV